MNTEKVIYEVLVRYGKNGEVQGMHVVYAFVVKDESGEIVAYNPGSPEAVTLGIEQGLNLSEVLGDLNTLNVLNIELLTNQLAQANAQIQSLTADKNALIVENESLIGLLDEKNQKIAELEALIDLQNTKFAESELEWSDKITDLKLQVSKNETNQFESAEPKAND